MSYRQRVQVKAQQVRERKEAEDAGGAQGSRLSGKPESNAGGTVTEFIWQEHGDSNSHISHAPVLPDPASRPREVKVFVSYSHQDEKFLGQRSLPGALKGLESEGVEFWSDRAITAGNKWDNEIKRSISTSHIALVLVSQSFLDSPYCQDTEIKMFLAEAESRRLVIFPVMLLRCEWERHDWLRDRQFLPGGGKNIEEHFTNAGKRRGIFHEIRQHLRTQIEERRAHLLPQDL
ncbi:MAG: toll/interleukin-1 receptor domain-containing protein [Acidobacteria bacterium]|nr:toll/interleukin-1 receptor domain-containing protein [Acidobacteriota bacterium]MCA1643551.1 toll/interleukin-1 receptor domain-containing protein [Acidobacteriota bacterium]